MSFPRYPAYKPSGVEWLGEVPEHWNLKPVFVAASERDEDNKGMKENNLLSLSYGNIINKDINTSDGLLPESFDTYQIVRPGDIVLRLTDLQNDKRSLRSALVTQTGIITSAYLALWPRSIESRYFNYLLRAYDVSKVFYSMGGGLRQSMKYGDIKRMPIVVPPHTEQSAITTFLDRETAKIDALIAEQQRLIELLQEKRQAVISHAVTKGLNPHAPMKDSGVEWLGEVPEHWSLISLGKLCTSKCDGPFGSGLKSEHYVEEGVMVVRLQNIKSTGYDDSVSAYIDPEYYRACLGDHDVLPGDVLVAGLGDENNLVGRSCVAPPHLGPAMVKADCFRFRLKSKLVSPAFASFSLNASSRFHGGVLSSGSTRSRIPLSVMASRELALPPPEEQLEIEMHIQGQLERINDLQLESVSTVNLLQERRSALISAAVTGQIDVRGLVPEADAA